MTVIKKSNLSSMVSWVVDHSGISKAKIASQLKVPFPQLSRYINGTRPFDLKTLDGITEMVGLPFAHFYDAYLEDCWLAQRNRSTRIQEFIVNTTANGRKYYADKMIGLLLDSGKELYDLYKAGEILEGLGYAEEALSLYDMVIENERNRLSECLALSYYKRFMIVRNWDMEYAFEAATKLGEHLRNLPEEIMFEAFIKILNVFYVLDKWNHLYKYSCEMALLIKKSPNYSEQLYGDCLIYKGVAQRKLNRTEDALVTIGEYGELSVERCRVLAIGNRLIINLTQSGNPNDVFDLYNFAKRYPAEADQFIEYILDYFVASGDGNKIEELFDQLKEPIEYLNNENDPMSKKRLIRFLYHKGRYLVSKGNLDEAIDQFTSAVNIAKSYKISDEYTEKCLKEIMLNVHELSDFKREYITENLF